MKITEKNDKVIEIKPQKQEEFRLGFKGSSVTEEEKNLLLVYYSYLKNLS